MNSPARKVAVVVALADPTPALAARLGRFAEEAGPLGEVLLVNASGDPSTAGIARGLANVRVVPSLRGRLAPELWTLGLLATDAPLVAFSTAQMVPRPGWLSRLVDRLHRTGAAGVGGPIEPGAGLSATDRAVALLRYSGYFPPLPRPDRVGPPGDNALYRRGRLMEVGPSWADGFWEAEVHRALLDRGESLAMAGGAVVAFEGGDGLASMARRRWAHARRYGAGRSRRLGTMARLARVAACPMVPPLLCGRIAAALRARGMAWSPWLPAVPGLAVLTWSWALGEAVGTWSGGAGLDRAGFARRATSPASPAEDRTGGPMARLSRRTR